MLDTLKPQFYVLRPNNVAIPLIAMDELPHNIRIAGVPRALTMEDVMEMKGVGKAEPRHQMYSVFDINKTAGIPTSTQDHPLSHRPPTPVPSASSSDINIPVSCPASDKIFPGPRKFYGVQEQKPDSDDETNILNHKVERSSARASTRAYEAFSKHDPLPLWKKIPEPGTRLPLPGKKVYCSHWMSTGGCDYAQQGCLYKHEMPIHDIELLNALGFQDIPKWYREKFGLGKLTAVPGSGAHIRGSSQSSLMQSSWRSGSGPTMSAKASRSPISAPMFRATSHTARTRPPRLANRLSTAQTGSAVQPKDLVGNHLLDTAPPSPSNKPTNGLLNSKYAPMTPLPVSASTLLRSGSDADISVSSTIAQTSSASNASEEVLPVSNVNSCTSAHPAGSPRSKWKLFAARSGLNDTAAGYMTCNSRRTSLVSDYEAGLERENLKHDMAEAAEYAEVLARHKSQEEQASLSQMQDNAVAAAKEKLHERPASGTNEKVSFSGEHSCNQKKAVRNKKRKVDGKKVGASVHVTQAL